jgi:hypothetical protein
LLLRKGSIIDSVAMIESLLARGAVIHLVDEATPQQAPKHLFARKSNASPFEALELLCEDLRIASFEPDQVSNFVGTLRSIALCLIDAVERDPDSSIASIFLNIGEGYAIRHQIHSAVLSVLLTKELEIPRNEMLSLVCAALTMNLAFLEYQDHLNTRSGSLTADERSMISKHSLIGEQMLLAAGVVDPLWLDSVKFHHEQWDGSGYPEARTGETIPLHAQILQMVDMFSARISVRSWGQKELTNATMADLLRSTAGNKCNPQLIKALIKALGAYPPGCFVQLANEELAVVVKRGQLATCPIVYSLQSRGLQLGAPVRRDTSQERFTIKALVPQASMEVPHGLRTLWGGL